MKKEKLVTLYEELIRFGAGFSKTASSDVSLWSRDQKDIICILTYLCNRHRYVMMEGEIYVDFPMNSFPPRTLEDYVTAGDVMGVNGRIRKSPFKDPVLLVTVYLKGDTPLLHEIPLRTTSPQGFQELRELLYHAILEPVEEVCATSISVCNFIRDADGGALLHKYFGLPDLEKVRFCYYRTLSNLNLDEGIDVPVSRLTHDSLGEWRSLDEEIARYTGKVVTTLAIKPDPLEPSWIGFSILVGGVAYDINVCYDLTVPLRAALILNNGAVYEFRDLYQLGDKITELEEDELY